MLIIVLYTNEHFNNNKGIDVNTRSCIIYNRTLIKDLTSLIKNKDNHINIDFYSILFSRETGIITTNVDKGSEGLIQLVNNEIEIIFKYKSIDLKGINISSFMPKFFPKYIQNTVKMNKI